MKKILGGLCYLVPQFYLYLILHIKINNDKIKVITLASIIGKLEIIIP